MAEAARAGRDEAMRGIGSDSAFVRWLTRKPLPVKMSGYRMACGICWSAWTVLFAAGLFSDAGFLGGLSLFSARWAHRPVRLPDRDQAPSS